MDDGPKKIVPEYAKPLWLGRAGERARGLMTREGMSHMFRRLAWVAPLTLLIWVYAERQQERRQTVRFQVELALNTPDRVIIGPTDRFITAELRGPAAQLEQVKNKLLQSGDKPAVTLTIDQTLATGSNEVPTARIASDPLFASHAITVDNSEPQTLSVYVDQLVDREVNVGLAPEVARLLDGNAVFDPPRVRVRAPRTELERVATNGVPTVNADLTGRESLKTPGVHEERAVPLKTALTGEHVSLTPGKVNVTVKVRPADVTLVWPFMPVWVNTPPGFSDKYRVVLTNQTLRDVRLTGPSEVLAAMQQESFRPKPKARLDVSNSDLPAGETRVKVVQFDDLPKGVSVTADEATRPVEFRIVDVTRE